MKRRNINDPPTKRHHLNDTVVNDQLDKLTFNWPHPASISIPSNSWGSSDAEFFIEYSNKILDVIPLRWTTHESAGWV
jgi:hypothetical protein